MCKGAAMQRHGPPTIFTDMSWHPCECHSAVPRQLLQPTARANGAVPTIFQLRAVIMCAVCVPHLLELAASPASGVQSAVAYTLFSLTESEETHAVIAIAGGIPPIVALLGSTRRRMRRTCSRRTTFHVAAAGIPPLVALLGSPLASLGAAAASVLANLSQK